MNGQLQAVADKVRQLRASHGMSLAQLAERSGVAKATLFKLERGRTNPTLDTLLSIAETFDVDVTDLLTMKAPAMVEVVAAGEGTEMSDNSSHGRIVRTQVISAGTLEIHWQTMYEGSNMVSPSHGVGAREHVMVQSGRIEVGPVGQEVVVGVGDYVTYAADGPHRWRPVDGDATIWITHIFPRPAI